MKFQMDELPMMEMNMFRWKMPMVIGTPATIVVVLFFAVVFCIIFFRRRRFQKLRSESAPPASSESGPRPFNWLEHPPLVSAAVENGWAGFVFAASGSHARRFTETGWEIGPESKDLMQRVSWKPGFKDGSVRSIVPVRTGLPLPGPPLGPLFFPQEAYWEVTVLPLRESDGRRGQAPWGCGGKIELMSNGRRSNGRKILPNNDEVEDVIWLGMTARGFSGSGFPGATPGSIGFSSTGIVYLDGKLCHEHHGEKIYPDSDKKIVWGEPNSVVGCGFDPSRRQLYFTIDSVLMRTIQCEWDIYSSPLYPTLAANFSVALLVNLGQSRFRYEPSNVHRTPDPSFRQPGARGSKANEDSGDLFSMGRIDPDWMRREVSTDGRESDAVDESGFFEIVLDPRSKSMPDAD